MASNPPIAGDPTITAMVITIPNAIPTIMNRLFILKLTESQIKTDCKLLEKMWKNALKEKLLN